jgi:hypothetical protein
MIAVSIYFTAAGATAAGADGHDLLKSIPLKDPAKPKSAPTPTATKCFQSKFPILPPYLVFSITITTMTGIIPPITPHTPDLT